MKIVFVENYAHPDVIRSWESFVEAHPDGTIFQTPHYFQLFADQKRFKPVAVLLRDEDQNITGVLSGIIQYQVKWPLKSLTSRCIVIGGPLLKDNNPGLLGTILDEFDKFVSKKAVYTQFRNLFDNSSGKSIFASLNYIFEDHLNILVDITKPEAALWKGVHKQKRYEIRRAARENLIFKPLTSIHDVAISYQLLKSIYKRIKLPVFPFRVFQNAFKLMQPEGTAVFWGAYLQNELVGTMYTFCYKGRIYDFFAGSNSIHKNKFPNSLIPWQVMMWGKSNGMTLFDWGGAGKPNKPYGVRDYKQKFGGRVVNFGRFEKIHKPLIFQIAKNVFQLWQRIKI